MLKSFLKFVATALIGFSAAASAAPMRSECSVPADYKERIESAIHAKEPEVGEFTFEYDQPARVAVGEAKKEVCAVRCHWTPARKATTFTSIFLFDGAKMTEAGRFDQIEWTDGEPAPENKLCTSGSGVAKRSGGIMLEIVAADLRRLCSNE